jgi:uncharacterized delta-60 repeat protein
MKALILSFLVAFPFYGSSFAVAAESDLDPTFGVGGRLLLDQWRQSSPTHSIVQQSDGKLVLASSSYGDTDRLLIARLNLDGTLDGSYGNSGLVTGKVAFDVAVDVIQQQDQKLVVVGHNWQGSYDAIIWRFKPSGDVDTAFGASGSVRLDLGGVENLSRVIQRADGKLVVAGTTGSGDSRLILAQFEGNGNLDPSFGDGGVSIFDLGVRNEWSEVTALLQLPNGQLIVAGHSQGYLMVVKMTEYGVLDESFGSGGFTAIAAAEINSAHTYTSGGSAVVQNDRIIASASAWHCEPDPWSECGVVKDGFIVRLEPSGPLDSGLGAGKIVVSDVTFSSIAVGADNTIVCAYDDLHSFGLMKFKSNGDLDEAFGTGGLTIADFGSFDDRQALYISQRMIRQADGRHVFVAGYALANSNDGWFAAVARFGADAPGFAGLLGIGGLGGSSVEGGSPRIGVIRTGGSTGEVSVDYETVDDTALAEQDYVSESGQLTWADGDVSVKYIIITTIEDQLREGSESYGLQLSNPTNGALLARIFATIQIVDSDDIPPPPPPPPPPGVGGGGGAINFELLVLLGGLLFVERLGSRRRKLKAATADSTVTKPRTEWRARGGEGSANKC